jgi:DNA polymerase V
MIERNILCIDLKSFFASIECVERGLDPFTTALVVADTRYNKGAITLAVTPYLKKMGVKSRGRVYELPKNIKIIYALPRMNLYYKKSKEVVNIFLNYVHKNDLHVYSIDESFLDVTDYLKLYKKTDIELASEILNKIYEKLSLTATCGIGPNMLLAKVAMDTEAKKNSTFIAKWTYDDVKTKLHALTPLSKMWGIGSKLESKLNNLGIYKIKDINKYSKEFYRKRFGVIGEELFYHANGIDTSKVQDYNNIQVKNKSYGISQVLYKDYNIEEATLIIREMCFSLAKRLRYNNKTTSLISFGVAYSKEFNKYFYHSRKINNKLDNENDIYNECISIYENYIEDLPIRKIMISLSKLEDKKYIQLNLFSTYEKIKTDNKYYKVIDEINEKFGDNSLLKASSLLENSTIKIRNTKMRS